MQRKKTIWITVGAGILLIMLIGVLASIRTPSQPSLLSESVEMVEKTAQSGLGALIEEKKETPQPTPMLTPADGPENASYLVDGSVITLKNGKLTLADASDPSKSMIITIWPVPFKGDLNSDFLQDYGLVLEKKVGSATNYYAAVAVNVDDEFVGTNAVPIPDVGTIQLFQISPSGRFVVSYLTSNTKLPLDDVAEEKVVSKFYTLTGRQLTEVEEPAVDIQQ